MKQRSPTLEGFRVMFTQPSLGLAEIAWRWSFGFAALSLLTISLLQYLNTLPVTAADLFLLQTRHPLLISHAIAHIFQGSAFRAIKVAILLLVLLSLAWTVVASWGRAMTVNALMAYFHEAQTAAVEPLSADDVSSFWPRAPLALNLLRVVVTVAAGLGFVAAFVLAGAVSPKGHPAPGSALLVCLTLLMGISIAWSLLNWILSLAGILVVADNKTTVTAISGAVELCRVRWGSLMAAGTWFGLAHLLVFVLAGSIVMFPVAFVAVLPVGMVLGGMLLVALLYFAAADFLYAGRLAAYVVLIQSPPEPVTPTPEPPLLLNPDHSAKAAPIARMDREELILSDI